MVSAGDRCTPELSIVRKNRRVLPRALRFSLHPGHQRASHADRERVIGMLETAFAAGLLSKDDLDRGVNRTLASRTYADLAAAAAGLRAEPPGPQPPPGRPRGRKMPLRGVHAGS